MISRKSTLLKSSRLKHRSIEDLSKSIILYLLSKNFPEEIPLNTPKGKISDETDSNFPKGNPQANKGNNT